MLSPRLIIFDLDGTLVEFPKSYLFNELERILPIIQVNVPSSDLVEHYFSDFNFFGFADDQHHVQNSYWHHFNWENFPSSRAFDFTNTVLSQLTTLNISSAIATARHCKYQELVDDLHSTGMLDFLHHIEARQSQEQDWKDKRPQIEKILNLTSCDPKDAIMVGDIPADIESAKECGLGASVAVLTGGIKEEILKSYNPDFILPDISHLFSLIKK